MSALALTDHEHRVLSYLDQRGQADRQTMVADLASPESNIGWRRDKGQSPLRGSNGAAPMLAARWCKRLIEAGLLVEKRTTDHWNFHKAYVITDAGRRALRSALNAATEEAR